MRFSGFSFSRHGAFVCSRGRIQRWHCLHKWLHPSIIMFVAFVFASMRTCICAWCAFVMSILFILNRFLGRPRHTDASETQYIISFRWFYAWIAATQQHAAKQNREIYFILSRSFVLFCSLARYILILVAVSKKMLVHTAVGIDCQVTKVTRVRKRSHT